MSLHSFGGTLRVQEVGSSLLTVQSYPSSPPQPGVGQILALSTLPADNNYLIVSAHLASFTFICLQSSLTASGIISRQH